MGTLMAYYQLIALALVNIVVSLRIHAMYQRRRDVLLVLAGFLLLAYAAAIYLQIHYFGGVMYRQWVLFLQCQRRFTVFWAATIDYTSIPQFQLCFATKWEGVWLVWLPMTIYESFIWCLTAYKTWEHWHVRRLPLRTAVLGDGILYHTCTLCARLLVLLLWRFSSSNPTLMLFGVNFSFSLITVASSRVGALEQPAAEDGQELRDSGEWARSLSPDLSLRRPKRSIWLANQGGQSFLEQIYQTTRDEAAPRPTVLYMDKFDGE
ncbi:hypothetical protein CALVIDRAFT_558271 [Calocera viscosa TUFC12733]|uniref:Uncharacterized protein n=1 Tax=Calocera viscosa (strain TUFC12733) TaxID=1330018 RepID=A0A167H5J3_CALVF|nr:hypothetical protein CALVIDRAFT_558271 [Calocera viscosa TUFC12733]